MWERKVSSRLPIQNIKLAAGCRLQIHWTCLFRIGNWIGNRQLVAGWKLPVKSWIGNRQLVASCRFFELILSISNLNRQPATSYQLPIRWTCLYRIGNWIDNRKLVASCRFVELVLSVSNLHRKPASSCRLPIRWTYISVSNRQLNRQPANESATGYMGPYIVSFESATESANGNWIGNRQPTANFMFWIGNRQLNRQPATHC